MVHDVAASHLHFSALAAFSSSPTGYEVLHGSHQQKPPINVSIFLPAPAGSVMGYIYIFINTYLICTYIYTYIYIHIYIHMCTYDVILYCIALLHHNNDITFHRTDRIDNSARAPLHFSHVLFTLALVGS